QIQAVLARRFLTEVVVDIMRAEDLNALRHLAVGIVYTRPSLHRLRLAPTEWADRRGCERYSEVGPHARREHLASDAAAIDANRVSRNGRVHDLRLRREKQGGQQNGLLHSLLLFRTRISPLAARCVDRGR